jgi:hypothetical protein
LAEQVPPALLAWLVWLLVDLQPSVAWKQPAGFLQSI